MNKRYILCGTQFISTPIMRIISNEFEIEWIIGPADEFLIRKDTSSIEAIHHIDHIIKSKIVVDIVIDQYNETKVLSNNTVITGYEVIQGKGLKLETQ